MNKFNNYGNNLWVTLRAEIRKLKTYNQWLERSKNKFNKNKN